MMCILFTAEHKTYHVQCTILRKMLTYFDFNRNNTSHTSWEGDNKKANYVNCQQVRNMSGYKKFHGSKDGQMV